MLKLIFDKVISLIALVVVSPLLIIILILSAYSTRSSGLFFQKRIGQYGKSFIIFKVRTMQYGSSTKIGRILRNSKLDELPQLFNILKGDMSLVGPRPDIPGYYDELKGNDRRVLTLKPGLTSLAALKYKNERILLSERENPKEYNDQIIFPDKVKMNLEYLRDRSFFYDLKIIFMTLKEWL